VTVAGKGAANTNGFKFLYVNKWSDESTWGGEVPPRKGESVFITKGNNILLDMSPPELKLLTIEGMLVFEDSGPLKLEAHYIMINGGEMRIGTEATKHTNDVEVVLHGTKDSPEIPTAGNKCIAVRKGVLEIRGVERKPTWTQIDGTVDAGTKQLTVIENIDWKAGDKIVIAGTGFDHTESEEHEIASVAGKTITLKTALAHRHFGEIETYTDGNGKADKIDMRAEVGLLTRNIKIHGVEDKISA
jgi:hypothetical protein